MSCYFCIHASIVDGYLRCGLHGHVIPEIQNPICRDVECKDTGDTLISPGWETLDRLVPHGGLSDYSDYVSPFGVFFVAPFDELKFPRLQANLSGAVLTPERDDAAQNRVTIQYASRHRSIDGFPIATEVSLAGPNRATPGKVTPPDEYGKAYVTVSDPAVLSESVATWLRSFNLRPTDPASFLKYGVFALVELVSETELRLLPNETHLRTMMEPAHD